MEYRPNSLLCVVAHPDDIEVCIGGTVAKWSAEGTEVHFLICTDGSKGGKSHDDRALAQTRRQEQIDANAVLGAHCVHQLSYCDGEIEHCPELVIDIAKMIRAHKPDAIFTMDPSFYYSAELGYANHRDHRVVGQATFDAFYPAARDASANNEHMTEEYEPHHTPTILMTNFEKSNFYVDVEYTFDTKMQALLKHASQFPDSEWISQIIRNQAEFMGRRANLNLAEGFVKLDIH